MSTDYSSSYSRNYKKTKTLDPSQVRDWFDRINLSLSWRKPYEDTWDRVIDYLKGKYFEVLDDEDKIYVNMVHPHVRVVIPAIYAKNPDVMVSGRPKKYIDDELIAKRAEVMQNLLRYYLKQLDIKTEVKLCLLDAILTGHAWAKNGYETQFAAIDDPDEENENETVISKVVKLFTKKDENDEEETSFEINEKIVKERPWILRTSPYDMIVPMLSRRPEELPWIAERFIIPYEQVMEDPAYEDFNTAGLKSSADANELLKALRGSQYKSIPYGDKQKYCILYEVWDGISKEVITLCEGHRKELQCKDSEYQFLDSKYHPYTMLRFNEIPDEFYPVSDIQPAEPQLDELNEVRTQMNRHRKRYNRRYLTKPGAFDTQAKADLKTGEDGTVVEINPVFSDQPIEDIIQPITDAQLPPEVYQVESRVRDDIFTILGTSDYASQASGGARTATEASIIASQSRFRVEERIDLVSVFVNQLIRNAAMISQRFMDKSQVGEILGLDAIYWQQLTDPKEIQGAYTYDIVYGSTTPINREVDREQYMKFYVVAKDDPYFDQTKLRLQLVRKFDLENPEDWLQKEISQALQEQLVTSAKRGDLLQASQDRSGSRQSLGRVPSQGKLTPAVLRNPRAASAVPGNLPQIPGGRGGTALVR